MKYSSIEFFTERLYLKILSSTDTSFIQKLLNTEGWLQFIGDRNVHTEEEALGYIEKIKALPDFYYWVVFLQRTMQPIGIVTFLKRESLEYFDIGFAFLPEYTGKGYAYEATRKVLEYFSSQENHPRILAITKPANTSSQRLLAKLGLHMIEEMTTPETITYLYSAKSKETTEL